MKTSKKLLVFSYNVLGDNMNNKLPKVFANPITNKINNNKTIYYSSNTKKEISPSKTFESIESKINKLFKSSKYVYKVDVEIETLTGIDNYKIIGKIKDNLITLDNKLIPISTIIDIKEL